MESKLKQSQSLTKGKPTILNLESIRGDQKSGENTAREQN